MNCLRGNMKFWLAKCFKSDLHEACCIFRSVLVQGNKNTSDSTRSYSNYKPKPLLLSAKQRHYRSQDPLQPSTCPSHVTFRKLFHTSLKHAYQKYTHPLTWITSYFLTWRRNEWILFDSPKKKLSQGSLKKKSQERTGLQPTCMLEVKKDMELNNPLIQMDFNNFLWGKGVRHIVEGERSVHPWDPVEKETPRSWNHWKQMSHFTM